MEVMWKLDMEFERFAGRMLSGFDNKEELRARKGIYRSSKLIFTAQNSASASQR